MSYNVSIQEKQDYIRVEVSGKRIRGQEEKDAIDVWNSVAEACNSKGIFRVLAVFSLTGALPIMAAYEIGKSLVKNDLLKKVKVAFVDLNEESQSTNRFVETVAVNRASSGDKGKVFTDEIEAKEWLLQP